MGILVGKNLVGKVTNDQAIMILVVITLFLSLCFSMGIKFIINDYFIKKYDVKIMVDNTQKVGNRKI